MKKILFKVIVAISFIANSCSFQTNEEKSIELVKAEWAEEVKKISEDEPNVTYSWKSSRNEWSGSILNEYIVSYVDDDGWGVSWAVDIDEKTTKKITGNEYLSRVYGFSRLDKENFKLKDITRSELKTNNYGLYYVLEGTIVNNTDKSITEAKLKGNIQLIFKDKTIDSEDSFWSSGFNSSISKYEPWLPNTGRKFKIVTEEIENVYLNYSPNYVFFQVNLVAEDPIGFYYNRLVDEIDIKSYWN